ncbi:MAG: Holliday junction branch migration protein RuvA, partial [Myxococcales bacterium]|nr:Holliday junction branch migration protein RuvA [Myxococcales bacterium]
MIGRLRGEVAEKTAEGVVLDVGGVGYEVRCPLTVLDRLPRVSQACTLAIHTHVREDQITLFGFHDDEERRLFRLLIGVSGIGPRLALACLSGLDAEAFAAAVANEDVRRLSSIPGIGKRTAERVVLELKEKIGRLPGRPATGGSPALADLESALGNLGYRPKEVEQLVAALGPQAAQ